MKNLELILSEAFENNTTTALNDAINSEFECSPLIDGMVSYSVIGFECCAFVQLSSAISSGFYNDKLQEQIEQQDAEDLDDLDDKFIDYWIEVDTERKHPKITAYCSLDFKIELLSESVDFDNFEEQCKKFVNLF